MLNLKNKILILALLVGFTTKSFALIGIPEIYISTGVSTSSSKFKTTTKASESFKLAANLANMNSFLDDQTKNYGSSALNLAVGITPINLPIFNTLRLEAQYYNNFGKKTKISSFGGVAFLDLRLVPFITPYVGFGLHSANIKIETPNIQLSQDIAKYVQISGYNANNKATLYSIHAGVSVKVPLIGLAGFVEYKAQLGNFTNNVKVDVNILDAFKLNETLKVKTNVINHGVLFGIKYFVL